jgi:outer membrane lipoprotein-sorting protein
MITLSGCATPKTGIDLLKYSTGWPETIRAEAVIELISERRLKGRAVILAKEPDSFRIEILAPFGRLIALLLSDGERLTVFADGELKTYRWNDPALPYPFSAQELVSFLMGKDDLSPTPPGAPGVKYEITRNEAGRIAKLVKLKDGRPVLNVEMSDYKVKGGYVIPHRISLKDGPKSLRIRYTSVEIAPGIKDDVFELSPLSPQ